MTVSRLLRNFWPRLKRVHYNLIMTSLQSSILKDWVVNTCQVLTKCIASAWWLLQVTWFKAIACTSLMTGIWVLCKSTVTEGQAVYDYVNSPHFWGRNAVVGACASWKKWCCNTCHIAQFYRSLAIATNVCKPKTEPSQRQTSLMNDVYTKK